MKTRLNTSLWGLVICLVALAVSFTRLPQAVAQEGDEPEAAADEETPAAEAKGGKKAGEPAAAAEEKPTNFLYWIIETSGAIGAVLLVLSIYFVATVVRSFMELRPEVFTPPDIVEDCEKNLQARDFTALYKRVKGDTSFFSTVLSAGIAELPGGVTEARDAMERIGEVNTISLEKKISMLAVLGTLGPMIGLLGTLKGMIGAFGAIAMSKGVQLEASTVAGFISEALVLTFEGVALSVPAIYFFALFRNRISTFSAAAMLDTDAFVRRLYAAMKSKPAAPPQPAAAPAAAPMAR